VISCGFISLIEKHSKGGTRQNLVEYRLYILFKEIATAPSFALCMVEAGGIEPTVRKTDYRSISERRL